MKNLIESINSHTLFPNVDLSKYTKYNLGIGNQYFYIEQGKEHYQLLRYISDQNTNKLFFDVGTNNACSALALSNNKNNKVISYDIVNNRLCEFDEENIEFIVGDVLQDDRLLKSDLIFLDTFHDGSFEEVFLNFLVEKKYKGILILDDVNEWPILRIISEKIANQNNFKLLDLTSVGHWSGTLVMFFS